MRGRRRARGGERGGGDARAPSVPSGRPSPTPSAPRAVSPRSTPSPFPGSYVAGTGKSATTLVYDPSLDRWTDGPPLPAPRSGALAVDFFGDVLLVEGGGAARAEPLRLRGGAWTAMPWAPREPAPVATHIPCNLCAASFATASLCLG